MPVQNSQDIALLFLRDVFSYILAGYIVARLGILKSKHFSKLLKKGVVLILLPILIFSSTLTYLKADELISGGIMAVCALVMVMGSYAISHAWYSLCGIKQIDRPSFVLGGTIHNYGFTVFPLVIGLLGTSALPLTFFYILGCDALFWALGAWILMDRNHLQEKSWQIVRHIMSPPLITLIASVVIVVTGWQHYIPLVILEPLELPGRAAIPMALFCIGGIIYFALHNNISKEKLAIKTTGLLLALRNLVLPLLWISCLLILPFSKEMATILIIEAIMPSSIGIIFLSDLYRADTRFITVYSVTSNLLSIISVPLLLGVLLALTN